MGKITMTLFTWPFLSINTLASDAPSCYVKLPDKPLQRMELREVPDHIKRLKETLPSYTLRLDPTEFGLNRGEKVPDSVFFVYKKDSPSLVWPLENPKITQHMLEGKDIYGEDGHNGLDSNCLQPYRFFTSSG
jgi:hypothetical protein